MWDWSSSWGHLFLSYLPAFNLTRTQPRDILVQPLAVGQVLPEIIATNIHGQRVTLNQQLKTDRTYVLEFQPGTNHPFQWESTLLSMDRWLKNQLQIWKAIGAAGSNPQLRRILLLANEFKDANAEVCVLMCHKTGRQLQDIWNVRIDKQPPPNISLYSLGGMMIEFFCATGQPNFEFANLVDPGNLATPNQHKYLKPFTIITEYQHPHWIMRSVVDRSHLLNEQCANAVDDTLRTVQEFNNAKKRSTFDMV